MHPLIYCGLAIAYLEAAAEFSRAANEESPELPPGPATTLADRAC